MAAILCIETSTRNCSVAIAIDGEVVALEEKSTDAYVHAEELHPFIRRVLHAAFLKPDQLDAVMVSSGPGSYTGLRIGVAAAKGMAYALSIPLLTLDTLSCMAKHVCEKHPDFDAYWPMIDAKRMEVYTLKYTREQISPVEAVELSDDYFSGQNKKILVFGDGAEKCQQWASSHIHINSTIVPSAVFLARPAEQLFLEKIFSDVAYFEPFYLKDFVPGTPKRNPLVK
jgi:tRNA threonylcarbamoyladenosine biosynthesis protein TsaB